MDSVKMRDNDIDLDLLLADYSERSEDYRRQIAYYPKSIFFLIAVASSSLAWVFGAKDPDSVKWVLPLSVTVSEIITLLLVYVYWSSARMKMYLIEIERYLGKTYDFRPALHSTDDDPAPEITFGYHYWLGVNPGLQGRLAMRVGAVMALISYCLLLAAMWFWGTSGSSIFHHGIWLSTLTIVMGLIMVAGITTFLILRHKIQQVGNSIKEEHDDPENPGWEWDDTTKFKLLSADFQERNKDYRSLIDNYYLFLTLLLSMLAGVLSLYFTSGNGWIFALAPVVIVTVPFFMIYNYRVIRPIRRYLCRLEDTLEDRLKDSGPIVHHGERCPAHQGGACVGGGNEVPCFRIGFFSVIRNTYWQRSGSNKITKPNAAVAIPAILIFIGLLIVMYLQTASWIGAAFPSGLIYIRIGLGLTCLMLLVDIFLFFEPDGSGS